MSDGKSAPSCSQSLWETQDDSVVSGMTGCMKPDCNTASWELRVLKQGRLGPRTSNGEQDETHSAKQTAVKNCYPEVRRRPRPAKREKVWTKQQSVCTGFCKSRMSKTLGSDYCLAKRRWAMIVEKKKRLFVGQKLWEPFRIRQTKRGICRVRISHGNPQLTDLVSLPQKSPASTSQVLGFQDDCHTQLAFTRVWGSSALTLHGYHFTHWPISPALEQCFWMMSKSEIHFRKNCKWFAHGIRTGDRGWGWLVMEESWGERSSLDCGICGPHSRGKDLTLQVILLGGEGVWDNSLTCKAWGEKGVEKQTPGARRIPELQV